LQTTMVRKGKIPPPFLVKDNFFVIFPPSIHVEHFVPHGVSQLRFHYFQTHTTYNTTLLFSRLIVTHNPISSTEL
jgi:hypothetical protein